MRKEEEQRALLSCMAQPVRYHSLTLSPGEKKRRQQPEQDTPELWTGLALLQPVQRVLSYRQAALGQRYSPYSSLASCCQNCLSLLRGWQPAGAGTVIGTSSNPRS